MNSFDFLKLKPKTELQHLSDFHLVKQFQEEIDDYRRECFWECPKCGYTIDYLDSLLFENEEYIHELRCSRQFKRKRKLSYVKCNRKMILKNKSKNPFLTKGPSIRKNPDP